jgi:phenylalanine-4-hydroxylase
LIAHARAARYTSHMFEEAQLYSPVTENEDGSITVELSSDHPGACDPAYRERRNDIAARALAWTPGEPIPQIEYTEPEHEVWRIVSRELAPKHAKYACREFREAAAALALPTDRIPQLDQVTASLEPLTGWTYHAAAGLVPLRDFLGALGDRIFHSTQYIRHGAMPLYTPEPDLIHEVIGHGNLLASPRFAAIKRAAGRAAQRVETDEALQFLADVFWFTIEFGVLREEGQVQAYGAGILSSYGEIEEFRGADLRPLDLLEMGTLEYDITKYQPVLFCADGMGELEDVVGGFFASFDDDTPARLRGNALHA